MAKKSKHYKRDGSVFSGKTHKMSNGELHTGATHTASSTRVYHYGELKKTAQKKARKSWR